MGADPFPRFKFNDSPLSLTKKSPDKIVIVNLPQKTDALTIFSSSVWQTCIQCNLPDFLLHQMSDREHEFRNLQIIDLSQKIRLILNGIFGCTQPDFPILFQSCGIMSRSCIVKILAYLLFKTTELNQFIAHHIRIGSLSLLNLFKGICRHIVPILTMQIDHLQRQTIFTSYDLGQFNIFLGRTIHMLLPFHSNLNIEKSRAKPLLTEKVNNH